MVEGFSTGAMYFNIVINKQDLMLQKQDGMLEKQDQTLVKLDDLKVSIVEEIHALIEDKDHTR